MRKTTLCCAAACIVAATGLPHLAPAQEASPEEAAVSAMRSQDNFGSGDQRRIREWIQPQIDVLAATAGQSDDDRWAAYKVFRATLKTQFENPQNSRAFSAELARQTAQIATGDFGRADADPFVTGGLARVLLDMNRIETQPALVAGLKSSVEAVRYLSARGLAELRQAIANDAVKFNEVVGALRMLVLTETSPVVLSHAFRALAYSGANQVPTVFEVYMAAFDRRLEARRGGAVAADGAEVEAYEFFRAPGVLETLGNPQKVELANRLAVYLRLDAERYATPDLKFYEIADIERLLDGGEAILSSPAMLGANAGGTIRDALDRVGHEGCTEIPPQAYLWVGDPTSNTPGALNAAPWNVPVGAP
jgi:hypothetical protein